MGRSALPLPCASLAQSQANTHLLLFSSLTTTPRYIDQIDWVKQTVNRRLAKSHGYYLQHGKETCVVGVKVS